MLAAIQPGERLMMLMTGLRFMPTMSVLRRMPLLAAEKAAIRP
jgi:hypothetical protein